jgi:hypothetical protein
MVVKKRSMDKKLSLSRETVRNLITSDLSFVAGGYCTNRISRSGETACDCSGSATASGTCGDCSTIQY